ncbi:hypothetical protein [Vibrio owensii]|uniref:hypothetical protein n=1 Tax=Vibrio owensii TaxID=696485 RepID=UPI0018F21C76|nr:hypothetical protein [Vibrio owensii]
MSTKNVPEGDFSNLLKGFKNFFRGIKGDFSILRRNELKVSLPLTEMLVERYAQSLIDSSLGYIDESDIKAKVDVYRRFLEREPPGGAYLLYKSPFIQFLPAKITLVVNPGVNGGKDTQNILDEDGSVVGVASWVAGSEKYGKAVASLSCFEFETYLNSEKEVALVKDENGKQYKCDWEVIPRRALGSKDSNLLCVSVSLSCGSDGRANTLSRAEPKKIYIPVLLKSEFWAKVRGVVLWISVGASITGVSLYQLAKDIGWISIG